MTGKILQKIQIQQVFYWNLENCFSCEYLKIWFAALWFAKYDPNTTLKSWPNLRNECFMSWILHCFFITKTAIDKQLWFNVKIVSFQPLHYILGNGELIKNSIAFPLEHGREQNILKFQFEYG